MMRNHSVLVAIIITAIGTTVRPEGIYAQQLLLMDRLNGNKIVNDSTVTISSGDPGIIDLTAYFTMKNNTDQMLSLNLRKTVHMMADSTIDYFCFGIKCWPETDTTNYPDTLQPGAEDYTFASHVVHFRRFEMPPLPFGESSITYTIFDNTSFPEPIEASVTVIYRHQSGLGLERKTHGKVIIYPNPATKDISIVTSSEFNGKVNLNIYNSLGIPVKEIVVYQANERITFPIDDLPAGCYSGRIENHAREARAFRFIK